MHWAEPELHQKDAMGLKLTQWVWSELSFCKRCNFWIAFAVISTCVPINFPLVKFVCDKNEAISAVESIDISID